MTEHGVSVEDLQSAGTSANAEQAYGDLGEDGQRAAWWFLGFEFPFLASFGLLLCAGCAFAARQLAAAGAESLARIARFAVIFGSLLAALSDLIRTPPSRSSSPATSPSRPRASQRVTLVEVV